MEDQIALYWAQHLLESDFRSKRAMALEMNVSYRALLRLFAGENSAKDTENILFGMLWYCIVTRKQPQEMLHGFAPN